MVTMAIASMWASMAAWFTPTVLFCATNLIIATIFIASNNTNRHQQEHGHADHPPAPISRVSSFLSRTRSFKLSSFSTTSTDQIPSESKTATYSSSSRLAQSIHSSSTHYEDLYPSEPQTQPLSQLGRLPSFLDRVKSFRISTQPETDIASDPSHDPGCCDHHVVRSSKSERASTKMKKSRSEMRINDDEDEDVDLRRPATARERRSHDDVDEEVDARADDFISRFKQQLRLQRIESLVRYNQMLNRGT